MTGIVKLEIDCRDKSGILLAPTGLDTPHERCLGLQVKGGVAQSVIETQTGQSLQQITPQAEKLVLTYSYQNDDSAQPYPDAIFRFHDSRFTRAADALCEEANTIAPELTGTDRIQAIACATAERFTYGHPPERFYEGHDEVPALGCGVTEGSCVDINTYFIAALRATGFEAGYVTGYFFPEEKAGLCNDMHCWVISRHNGICLEWDIAHHLKIGRKDIEPGLNPKPGCRHAVAHSMGLDIPAHGIHDMKLIAEPIWLLPEGQLAPSLPLISRLSK
ncbi:transglutaminase-like domain-containing protein [Cohaesibacter intestini]|uniref:transglutaminase-like domain-containing protein n=1 Tax=Cohaesibacter intestini TaxID=2211145 RepID=UPI000DEB4C8D|nr:transglutaminase-like domain-containing protein [Cohaesibacter intestini]